MTTELFNLTARTEPGSAKTHVHVRLGSPDDADALTTFAARAFTSTYAQGGEGPIAVSRREDVAAYVAAAFTPERQRAELRDPDVVTLVAEDAKGSGWAGYAQLRLRARAAAPPPACAGGHPRELARLYVDLGWQGRGVADALVDAVQARACAEPGGADPLWLAVYQANARAVAFYRRRGFVVAGEVTFVMGAETQQDWLMTWRPGTGAPAAGA